MKVNAEVFFKLIVSPWVSVARHTQSTQNNKLAISMQYLKQNVNDEVVFLPEDKHQRFLQLILSFYGCVPRHAQISGCWLLESCEYCMKLTTGYSELWGYHWLKTLSQWLFCDRSSRMINMKMKKLN